MTNSSKNNFYTLRIRSNVLAYTLYSYCKYVCVYSQLYIYIYMWGGGGVYNVVHSTTCGNLEKYVCVNII